MKRLAVVALLLAIAALLWWLAPDPALQAQKAPAATLDTSAQVATAQGAAAPSSTAAPSRIAADEPPTDLLATNYEFPLEVTWGRRGMPFYLFLGTAGANCNRVPIEVGEGRKRLVLRGLQPTLDAVIDFGLLRRVTLRAGASTRTSIGDVLPLHVQHGTPCPMPTTYPLANPRFTEDSPIAQFTAGTETSDPGLLDQVGGRWLDFGTEPGHTAPGSSRRRVHGHVLDSAGAPLANRRVLWVGDDGGLSDTERTDANGAFLFAEVPTSAGWLWACNDGSTAVLPAVRTHVVATADFDHVLTLDPTRCKGRVQVEPIVPAAIPAVEVAIRLWQLDTDFGVHLARYDDGTFAAHDLPPGRYRCELVAPGLGVVPIAAFWVDGEHDVMLGRFVPPSPASLLLVDADGVPVPADAAHTGEPRVLRIGPDVHSWIAAREGEPWPTLLPAGDYALTWRDRTGRTRWQHFAATSGATVTLVLDR